MVDDQLLDILYQDDHLVIINKPSGLLVHRTALASQELDAVVQRLNQQLGKWVYPVHRLDRGTSGALLLALSSDIATMLCSLFEQQAVEKHYLCLVRGHPQSIGTIDSPLAKLNEVKGRARFKIEGTEKAAVTHFQSLSQYILPHPVSKYPSTRCSLLKVNTEQGRKHQIRRHFKHIRHPLLGDTRYGCRHHNKLLTSLALPVRLLLHAHSMTFTHPITKENICVTAPIENSFQSVLNYLQPYQVTM
ncbi:pseudouridylate synthase [Marinomonas agarivorans]|nr:pseudouridylate synthase [Marinomonas agarivorans]